MPPPPEPDELPPPHPDTPRMAVKTSSMRAAVVALNLRLRPIGIRNRMASTEPRLMLRTEAAVWTVLVAIVTVKDVLLPPAIVRVAGMNVQDACAGKLPHEKLRVPEYPFAGTTVSAYVADCPAVTVLLVLPPACVPIAKGVCDAVPERSIYCSDGVRLSAIVNVAEAAPAAVG